MVEITQRTRRIRSFYAKKQKRVGRRWVKQHEKQSGILIITCLVTKRQFISRASNIRQMASYWRRHIRIGDTRNRELDTDIAKYGIDQFTVKVGEILPTLAGESREHITLRLNLLYREYVAKAKNLYNKEEVISRYLITIERSSYEQLSSFHGTPIDKTQDIYGPVVFVIVCKVTRKHYVCGVVNFKVRYFEVLRHLRAGIFKVKELQEEWNRYGKQAFLCNFCRVSDRDVLTAKRIVLQSIGHVYGAKEASKQH